MTRPDADGPTADGPPPLPPGNAPRARTGAGPASDGGRSVDLSGKVSHDPVAAASPGGGGPRRPAGAGWGGAGPWLVPLLALVAGLTAGFLVSPTAPGWLAPYLPVAVVAALDALAGGLRAALERVFDDRVFVVSFLTNVVVAVLLVAVGERLGVGGALTTAVLVVFGIRIFTNATALRRHLFRI